MSLPSVTLLNWCLVFALELSVLVLSVRRGLSGRLSGFVGYASVLVLNEILMFCIYKFMGFNSKTYFYFYWVLQGLCILLRAIVVYQICKLVFAPFAGVWRLTKPALLAIGLGLVAVAGLAAQHSPYFITTAVLTSQAGLELAIVCLLIAGLGFCRYYSIRVERYLTWIAFGYGFYSIVHVADNISLQHWSAPWPSHFAMWNVAQHSAFDIALVMWVVALWKPLPAKRPAPAPLSGNVYQTLSPVITVRLRELNARLLEMWK